MNTKAENLRPWARSRPRLALVSVHLGLPLLFLLCVLSALLEGFQGFKEECSETFSDMWPNTKRWTSDSKLILRREIANRKKVSVKEIKK